MYKLNEDLSIYVTRGDAVLLDVKAKDKDGNPYTFVPGDLVRFKVCKKKNTSVVVLQKDFPITTATQSVQVYLSKDETKIGTTISKPVDYWYEVELNPLSDPQTIIGYDEDGAKVFKLFPEGADKEVEGHEPDTEEEKLLSRYMDDKLDLSSTRPVENQVIARAIARLEAGYDAVADIVTPQMFGAIGDGETDDTKAVRKLSDFLVSEATTKGIKHEVKIPSGTYRLTDTWAIPRCHIKGYGAKLVFDCSNKSLIDFINYADEEWCYEVIIEGLVINTTETENHTNIGIDMDNTSQLICRDVYIFNCHIGINYVNASITTIERPTIQHCDIAVFIGDYSSTLNISNCDFYENEVGFKCEGYSVSIFVSDSYFEEQDVDVLVEGVTTRTILSNFVFDRVHIVKANLLNKETDTYVLKTIKSNENDVSADFKFDNCFANFTPNGRKHHFAYNDSCNRIVVESNGNGVYYTSSQEGAVIFKTVNTSYYQYVVVNNGFTHDSNVALYSGSIRKCGVDSTGGHYTLVNSQLTFDELPDAEVAKSIFYNHYTDRLIYKNASGANLPIVCGMGGAISKVYEENLGKLKNSFNDLLDILAEIKIVSLE